MSKFLDMFDSFFFVAKKKFTHLSFLHVYHHGIMPLECWFGAKWETFRISSPVLSLMYVTSLDLSEVVTVVSLPLSMLVFILSCISTTSLQLVDLKFRNIFGGKGAKWEIVCKIQHTVKLCCRYLTRLQMVQFILVFIHGLMPMYYDCGYPNIMPMVRHLVFVCGLVKT